MLGYAFCCGINIDKRLTGNLDECVRSDTFDEPSFDADPGIDASLYTVEPPCGWGGILYGGLNGFGGGTGRYAGPEDPTDGSWPTTKSMKIEEK